MNTLSYRGRSRVSIILLWDDM